MEIVGRKQEKTRQVHVQKGQVKAALDQVKERKEERDEKNNRQQTHLPNCLNYPVSLDRNAQPLFRINYGTQNQSSTAPPRAGKDMSRTGSS